MKKFFGKKIKKWRATFFPDSVRTSDDDSHSIELKVLPNPHFAGCEPVSVQQGAGMVVTKGDEAEIKASVTFLKYFTAPENNIQFSIGWVICRSPGKRIKKKCWLTARLL